MTGSSPGLGPGSVVAGRYRVERLLGVGGMGAVYLAVQEPLGRTLVLKTLRPDHFGDPIAVERFKNEANVIATLSHPHIVGVYDFGTAEEGTLYLAMEHVPGRTLADTLRLEGPLSSPRALRIVRDIARALAAAHRRGIVHRDLKPENVMLLEAEGVRDFVKVLDFGIAKAVRLEGEGAGRLTGSGLVPGTPGYIAPEQIVGGSDDPRVDLYALGVTWFELLTGQRPYTGENAMRVFLAQLDAPVPFVAERAPGALVPEPVEAVLRALLARDPASRPAHAEALLAEIAALEEQGFSAGTDTGAPRLSRTDPAAIPASSATETSHSTPALPRPPAATEPLVTTPTTGTASQIAEGPPRQPSRARRALRFAPAAVIAVLVVVVTVLALNPWSRAFLAGEDALPIGTFNPEVTRHVHLSLTSFLAGDFEAAEEHVDAALERSDQEAGAWFMRGLMREWAEETFGPPAELQRAFALEDAGAVFPGKRATMDLIEAMAAASRGTSYPDSLRLFEESCDACRSSYLGQVVAAHLIARQAPERSDEALALLDDALAREPALAVAHAKKASILRRQGALPEALAAAEAGLAASPGSPALVVEIGRTLIAQGEPARAVERLRGAFARALPVDVQLLLARALLLAGSRAEADRLVMATFENTTSPRVRHRIARDYGSGLTGIGRPRQALGLVERAVRSPHAEGQGDDAALTLVLAMQMLDAAGEDEGLIAALELGRGLLDALILSDGVAAAFHAVQIMAEGIHAVRRGEVAEAANRLSVLEQNARLGSSAKDTILHNLRYELALAGGRTEEAVKLTALARGVCRPKAREAAALEAGGRHEGARTAWTAVLEQATACRASGFEGAFVVRALLALTEDAAQDPAARERYMEQIAAWYPDVEPDAAIGQRLAALRAGSPPLDLAP